MGKRNPTKTKETDDSRSNIRWLYAIICVHIVLGLIYWHYTPFGASPDEDVHARYVQKLVNNRALLVFDVNDRENYEAHQPPLYYILAVPFYMIGRVGLIRLLSLILGAISILTIYYAVKNSFGENKLAISAAGFTAFLPTHVMLSSSVSNDMLCELIFGACLLVTAIMIRKGLGLKMTACLGIILGAGLLSKSTCVLLFPVVILAYFQIWQRGKAPGKTVILHLITAMVISLVVGGWWLVRNQILYGDPLVITQFQQAFQHTAKPEFWLSHGWTWWMYCALVIGWTFASFWGVFGYMKVFMPAWVYLALAAITLSAKIGSIKGICEERVKSEENKDVILIYGLTLFLVILTFVKFNIVYFQAQGRYFYPAIVPISVFWSLGINRLLPKSKRHFMPYLVIGIPVIVQIIAITTCIVSEMPYYM